MRLVKNKAIHHECSVEAIEPRTSLGIECGAVMAASPKLSSPFDHPHPPFLQRSTPMSFQVLALDPNCNCLDWVLSAFMCFLYCLSFSAFFLKASCSAASFCIFLFKIRWLLTTSSYFLYSSGEVILAITNLLRKVTDEEFKSSTPIVSSGMT